MLKLRTGLIFVLILPLLPICGSGCNVFTKSALGKLGISIPSLVDHRPEEASVQRIGSDQHPDADKEHDPTDQHLRAQNNGTVRGQQPSAPVPAVNPAVNPNTVGTASGEVFEPILPLGDLPPLEQVESSPWDNPLGEFPDVDLWMGDDKSISLGDNNEQKNKDAARTAKYEKMLENSTSQNPHKPWLDPLPHPYGLFSYRETSSTMGLGGEFDEEIGFVPFDPVTKKPLGEIDLYDWEKNSKESFDWTKFDPVHIVTNIRTWMGMGPDEKKAAAFMEQGYALMRSNQDFKNKEKNIQAAKLFEKAAARWPDSVLEEDALFLAAECYYFTDTYHHAAMNYSKLARKHRSTKHMDTSMMRLFRIGRYWEKRTEKGASFVNFRDKTRPKMDTFGNMRKAYETIFTCDPMGPFGDKALMALAGAYMNRGINQGDSQFVEAAVLYASLPDINARSEYLLEAKKLELYAKSMSYVGSEYDSKALDESLKLADNTIKQYGSELGAEKDNILDLKESLNAQRVDRLYESGVFHEKKKAYSTARFHYERLMQEYPSSPRYAEVQQRYARIEHLEDMDDNMKRIKSALTLPGSRNAGKNAEKRIETDAQFQAEQEQAEQKQGVFGGIISDLFKRDSKNR